MYGCTWYAVEAFIDVSNVSKKLAVLSSVNVDFMDEFPAQMDSGGAREKSLYTRMRPLHNPRSDNGVDSFGP